MKCAILWSNDKEKKKRNKTRIVSTVVFCISERFLMIFTRCNPMPADATRRKMITCYISVLIRLVCFPNLLNSLMLDTNLVSHLKTKWEIILP